MVLQALSGANLIVGDPLLDVYEINTPAACNAVNSPTDDALCSSSSNLASSDTASQLESPGLAEECRLEAVED